MAMTKPKRTPPTAIKTNSMSALELATVPELIDQLGTRVGALVIAWTNIPKLVVDRKNHKAQSVVKGKAIEHDGSYRIDGPACLIESLLELIEDARKGDANEDLE